MVTSTSFSGSARSCGSVRASRSQKVRGLVWECRPGASPTGRAGGPDDNWSRVRDQRLQGQTGQSLLMGWRAGRPGRGAASTGPTIRRGDGGDVRLRRLVLVI